MNEIQINSSLGSISINFEEMQAALTEAVAGYKTAVYTDETIKEAKADRAFLRKQADEIEKKRKAIKKEFMQPYTDFEAQCKTLVALIDEGTTNIDLQIKEYEERLRKEKRLRIREVYEEAVPEDMRDILTLERIYKTEWENQTCTLKSIKEDMVEKQTAVFNDLQCIANSPVPDEDKDEARKVYNATLMLSSAMARMQEMQTMRQRILDEERKKQEEARLAAAKAEWEAQQPMNPPTPEIVDEEPESAFMSFTGFGVITDVTYKVNGTDEDYSALEELMTRRGMVWQRV